MQHELFAVPDTCCGRTSPEHSPQTADTTLLAWLEKWLGQTYLYREMDGKTPALVLDAMDSSSGACWTRNMSEWNHIPEQSHSDVDVCSLSSILETGKVDRQYYLSQKACAGILRRAERRGKELPMMLRHALEQVAGDSTVLEKQEGKTL